MMKKLIGMMMAAACAAGFGLPACAGVAVGENVLNNAALEFGDEGGPLDWNLSYEDARIGADFVTAEGHNVIRFKPRDRETVIRQADIALKEGTKVRVGAWVRTKGYAASAGGVVIYNWAWTKADGPGPFPRDTDGKWVKFEKEVVVPASSTKRYTFAVYTVRMAAGVVEVRDPYLQAVDQEGADATVRAQSFCELGVVTPVAPLLAKIPAGDTELQFSFINRVKRGRCAVAIRMDGEKAFREHGAFELKGDLVRAPLKGLRSGRGVLRATMRNEAGAIVAESEYPIRVIEPVKAWPGRPLNGLVTRLLTATAKDGDFTFEMPRDGWVWISFAKGGAALAASLDGQAAVAHRDGEGYETLRHVKAGRHVLSVTGAAGGELVVNRVPATSTYSYPLPIKPLECYRSYAGDFMRRRMFPAIGIWSCGYPWRSMPKDELADFRARGKEYYSQIASGGGRVESCTELARRLGAVDAGSPIVGRTFDEIPISSIGDKLEYSKALRLLAESELPVATWSSGYTFNYAALNAEYLSACVNQGLGEGVFQFECYPYICADEAEAGEYYDKMLNDSVRRAKRLVPGVLGNSWIVMGTYTRLDHSLNYDDCVEADYKRHVDLYLHRLATDPEFEGLAGVGLYCYHNAEEEDLRWLLDLFRHYLREGRTDMPSEKLGYTYNPGILTNGNFAAGLADWKVRPAEEGSVSSRRIKGLDKLFKYRDSRHGGDSACVLRRSKAGQNAVGKELTGLVPGKVYSLRYAVTSLRELADKDAKPEPRDFGVKAVLSDVEDLTASSPLERINGAKRDLSRLNVRFIVFRARKPTARLGFFDTAARDDKDAGEELALSAVRVKPYYWGDEPK